MTDLREQEDDVFLFMGNGDGTFTCSWCERIFPDAIAVPDGDYDPICPECEQGAIEEENDANNN